MSHIPGHTDDEYDDREHDSLSGAGDTSGPDGAPIKTVDLGTSVVVYFANGTYQVLPKDRFPSAGSAPRQSDPDLPSQQALERELAGKSLAQKQAELAEQQRQFNEKFGFDKAAFNARQAVDEGGLTGYFRGAPTLDRDKLSENSYQFSAQQAFDYYRRLQDLASNPRNFVANFFQNRGQAVPPGAQAYGNTSQKLSAMKPFEQFLPEFLGSQGRGYGRGATSGQMAGQQAQTSRMDAVPPPPPAIVAQAPAPSAGPVFTRNGVTSGASVNLTTTNGITTPEPTLAATGVPGANTGQTIPLAQFGGQEPAWLRAALSGGVAQFARGGVVPEPVIGRGIVSGQTYTFGEQGPEGVVPANMLPDFLKKRGGDGSYALGGLIGYDEVGAPGGGDPFRAEEPIPDDPYGNFGQYTPDGAVYGPQLPVSSQLPVEYGGTATTPYTAPTPAPTTTGSLPSTTTGPAGPTNTVIPPPQPFSLTPEQQAEIQRQIAETAARNRQQTTTTPPTTTPPTTTPPTTPPVAPPVAPPIQQPVHVPQGPTTATPVAAAPAPNPFTGQLATNRDVSAPGTFGRSIPGAGPQFLAGEDTGESTLQALLSSGMLPPFLSRLFGQREGIQSVGTNRGQAFDLPQDVPVVSELALSQMTPSEREAFLSYVSSYGLDPADYLDYVRSLGPTGGAAQSPLFGARLQSFRQ